MDSAYDALSAFWLPVFAENEPAATWYADTWTWTCLRAKVRAHACSGPTVTVSWAGLPLDTEPDWSAPPVGATSS